MFGLGGKAVIFCSVFRLRFLVSTFESFLGFREFFPRLSAIFFKRARGSKIRSHCLRSLIGQLSLLLVPNMVLSKMNNHEHRSKQTYESYTFQPLMSFWCQSKGMKQDKLTSSRQTSSFKRSKNHLRSSRCIRNGHVTREKRKTIAARNHGKTA